jgi:hypothetical protein
MSRETNRTLGKSSEHLPSRAKTASSIRRSGGGDRFVTDHLRIKGGNGHRELLTISPLPSSSHLRRRGSLLARSWRGGPEAATCPRALTDAAVAVTGNPNECTWSNGDHGLCLMNLIPALSFTPGWLPPETKQQVLYRAVQNGISKCKLQDPSFFSSLWSPSPWRHDRRPDPNE